MDDLDVGDMRPGIGRTVLRPRGRDRVERGPHSPVADRVEMRLESEGIELRHPRRQPSGVDLEEAAVLGRAAAPVAVRLEHGAREVLEHAIHHELHARRCVASHRGRSATLDELLDLLGAAVTLPPHRPDHAPGELASRRQGHVGALFGLRSDDGVLPGRDPKRMQVCLADAQCLLEVGRRRVRLEPLDELHRALVQGAAGVAVGLAFDAPVGGVARVRRDAADLERA